MRAINPLLRRAILRNPFSFLRPQSNERCDLCSYRSSGRRLSSLVEKVSGYERDQPCDDADVTEKRTTLHFALKQVDNLSLHRFFGRRHVPVISTGSLSLDLALGIGGLPKGRMVEIYGKEASGKTTLALHIVKEAQKLGGYCAYLDVENAMDPSLAEAMGIDIEKLIMSRPNSAEKSLSIVNTLVKSDLVDVVVVDSVAALVPESELAGLINIHSRDVQSRLMTQALRKINDSLTQSRTLIIFVNQVRTNTRSNQLFGPANEVTCGGNALRFYAAIRMRTTRRELIHTGDEVTGVSVGVEVVKNKLAPPMKKARLDIEFGRGISHEAEILEMCSRFEILQREGTGFWINGLFFKDQKDAEKYLEENNEVYGDFISVLGDHMSRSQPEDLFEAEEYRSVLHR